MNVLKLGLETDFEEIKKNIDAICLSDIEKVARILNMAHSFTEHADVIGGRVINRNGTPSIVYIAGNGGSASTAQHFASDLENNGVFTKCLVDNMARITAITNDKGWGKLFTEQMKQFSGDILVLFTVHGSTGEDSAGAWSQNLLHAAKMAKERSGTVIVISGCNGGELVKYADAKVVIPSGDVLIVEGVHVVITHLIIAALISQQNDK